jgi:hypothetical protein
MRPPRVAIAVVVLVLGLAFTGTAMADPPVIDQYQEPLPTGGGNEHTGGDEGSGGASGDGAQLPSSTQNNLESSVSAPVAEALESVATSPELGAPQGTIGKKSKQDAGAGQGSGGEAPGVPVEIEPLTGSPLSDAVSAATDGGNSHLLAVLLALGALTLGGGLVALARRRQTG